MYFVIASVDYVDTSNNSSPIYLVVVTFCIVFAYLEYKGKQRTGMFIPSWMESTTTLPPCRMNRMKIASEKNKIAGQ